MRLEGIRQLLVRRVTEPLLRDRIRSVLHRDSTDVKRTLNSLTLDQLVRLVAACPEIDDRAINDLWEEYRYGDRPSLYVMLLKNISTNKFDADEVLPRLNDCLRLFYSDDDAPSIRNVQFVDYEYINDDGSVVEMRYSYEQRLDYISPQEEQACYIYELKHSFCWLSLPHQFLVLHGAPEIVRKAVQTALEETLQFRAVRALVTKQLVNRLFEPRRRRRLSLYNPRPTGNRYKRVTFSDDEQAVAEVPTEYSDYEIPSALYREEIEGGQTPVMSSLGVNTREAKFYLTRPIRATQLRRWGVRLIMRLLPYIQAMDELADSTVSRALLERASSILRAYTQAQKELIVSLTQVIGQAISAGGTIQHGMQLSTIARTLEGDLYVQLDLNCGPCGQPVTAICPTCQGLLTVKFDQDGSRIFCPRCERFLSPKDWIGCIEGHKTRLVNGSVTVVIFPTSSLNETIARCVNQLLPQVSYSVDDDLFVITDTQLVVLRPNSPTVYQPEQLAEFKDLSSIEDIHHVQPLVGQLSEKCRFSSHEACQRCFTEPIIPCLLKLFAGEPGFQPHPHHGQEFGDVYCYVTVGSQQLLMQGVVKSGRRVVTRSSTAGRELLQQSINALLDSRVELLAPMVPASLDPQLMSQIALLARKFGKKVVFWDIISLSRLARKRQMQGYEIITDKGDLRERLGLT